MHRLILITGTGRSGTSLVAGMFSKLGIPTGPDFPADRTNIYGFFEDINVVAYNDRLMQDDLSHLSEYKGYLLGRVASNDAVVKDPRFTEPGVWERVLPILPRPYRIVVCLRNHTDTVQSYLKAYGGTPSLAEQWWRRRHAGARHILKNIFAVPVDFDELLRDPKHTALQLAALLHLGPTEAEKMTEHVQDKREETP